MANIEENLGNIISRQFLTQGVPPNPTDSFFVDAMNKGLKGFSVNYINLTSTFIEQSHSHLMSVVAWTVQNSTLIDNLVGLGVDGFITNDVELTLNTLNNYYSGSSTF
jgi:glycerophosphoryl diester phosphodiesterase